MTARTHAAARQAAAAYLVSAREPDGHWEDYRLPVGVSDAWVTAYVALALAGEGGAGRRAARGGAAWLLANRRAPAGWGYNAVAGLDADSTAHALLLLRALGRRVPGADTAWLLARRRADGGFATFDGPGAWGTAHPDVTPPAFRALPAGTRRRLGPRVLRYAREMRHPDGSWPAYWWRTRHYATYHNLLLLRALGCPARHLPVTRGDETRAVHTVMDLALVLAAAAVGGAPRPLVDGLARALAALQRPDGGWEGGPNLRVTDPACERPWEAPAGKLYTDLRGLITTATALAALRHADGAA
ncbi:MAG TPA: prenyltransferase/squalene oxidase repeat-containing protein [Longimicrobium sp.]|nr:prenyltransferase/squalene oxidase repeat-containing protein [Longimicrobium sp.]